MEATPNDIYTALALTVRDHVHKQGVRTMEARNEQEARVVAYLSAEFLTGPHLANNQGQTRRELPGPVQPSISDGFTLGGRDQASHPLVQKGRQRVEAALDVTVPAPV